MDYRFSRTQNPCSMRKHFVLISIIILYRTTTFVGCPKRPVLRRLSLRVTTKSCATKISSHPLYTRVPSSESHQENMREGFCGEIYLLYTVAKSAKCRFTLLPSFSFLSARARCFDIRIPKETGCFLYHVSCVFAMLSLKKTYINKKTLRYLKNKFFMSMFKIETIKKYLKFFNDI